ncbi:MAG: arginine--tRNA ligase [Gammaproteobacteria bacterium]
MEGTISRRFAAAEIPAFAGMGCWGREWDGWRGGNRGNDGGRRGRVFGGGTVYNSLPMRSGEYKNVLARVFADACAEFSADADAAAAIETPREKGRGDFACAAAMRLAAALKRPPRDIAADILRRAALPDFVEDARVDGGYINITIKTAAKLAVVRGAILGGADFGRGEAKSETVLLEFVSANPTGPLHIGHGRAAAYGDSLANILEFAGYEVRREYYVNDAGRQAEILAASVWLRRWLSARGRGEEPPAGAYLGDYLAAAEEETRAMLPPPSPEVDALLREMRGANSPDRAGDLLAAAMRDYFSSAKTCAAFVRAVSEYVLRIIKKDLELLAVSDFDRWFSEQTMHEKEAPAAAIDVLQKRDPAHLYEKDGALWFRATDRGDDKDRVLRRADGRYTYFAADIAYHRDKFSRGGRLINVLGADHHGYVPRLKAAVAALGHDAAEMETVLIQFVSLINAGQRIKMSTRGGEFVSLEVLVREIGRDAARFFYVSRKNDRHLDFDLRLAAERSRKNPVFYLQYAHARAASVLRIWGGNARDLADADCAALSENAAAMELCSRLAAFPAAAEQAASDRAAHSLAAFLQELAAALHNYYERTRILVEPPDDGMPGRLALLAAAQIALRNGLSLLGVSAPQRMERE